ncbi:MAG: 2-oxo-4-hydroxy-4-carboxy-5-ureidoimidazoline decarboxylase [Chloroflexota bacterium]|nr:2-oxo-4-hydroxy-4-carboxy-5-ureidoimidazoline decarboxylase [Chloroflexota bacterium]MDQ5865117.1 2-oxo-4-hydroxy-4-carboxy-5-ureidoimidazoline decarboxylase [Chloroflexota bacterium]
MTIEEVNSLDQEQFVSRLGFLFEGSPWIGREAWHARPFASLDDLHQALCRVMYGATQEQQVSLIRAHPDLVGRAALSGSLTPESTREQASAGLDRLTPEEVATFGRLNSEYKARFDFPFVVCARENKKDSILAGFASRMNNSRGEEISTALREISKIAYLRLLDVMQREQA